MFTPGQRVRFNGFCVLTGGFDHPLGHVLGKVLERHGPDSDGHDCTVLVNSLKAARCIHILSGVSVTDTLAQWLAANRIHASGDVTWEANMQTELDTAEAPATRR